MAAEPRKPPRPSGRLRKSRLVFAAIVAAAREDKEVITAIKKVSAATTEAAKAIAAFERAWKTDKAENKAVDKVSAAAKEAAKAIAAALREDKKADMAAMKAIAAIKKSRSTQQREG